MPTRPKPRLLAVGYARSGTGFSRVLDAILHPLAADYDVHLIAIGYKGPVREGAVTRHPCNLEGGDVWGLRQARAFVAEHRPAVVLLLNDLWILAKYLPHLAPYRTASRIVCYCPLDGEITDEALAEPLQEADLVVAYTDFGRGTLARAFDRLARAQPDFRPPPLDVIQHGVDTAVFHPIFGGRSEARRRLLVDVPDWRDAFIVLNANRPQPRKRIDVTMEGFARFARGKPPGVKLWLHHAVMRADEREALLGQAARLGITDRLRLSPADAPPLADADLNLVYNACDIGLNTASGEGWGLVSFEHAATGAAQIVPNHSACGELWAGAAELVEPVETSIPRFSLLQMRHVDAGGVAAALERLYVDELRRQTLARAATRNANRPAYRWSAVADRWRTRLAALRATPESVPT